MKKGISGSGLKIIAVITMFIDHIGAVLVERAMFWENGNEILYGNLQMADTILRAVGRISFPIFCFLLTEGFLHTGNLPKYMLRLGIFAVVSEIPFDLAFYGSVWNGKSQNIFFSLLIGLIVMWAMERTRKMDKLPSVFRTGICILWGILGSGAAELFHTDYGARGIICMIVLYLSRFWRLEQVLFGALAFYWEFPAPLAFLPVFFYNGKRGKGKKMWFYFFYPLHLLVLYLAAVLLGLA